MDEKHPEISKEVAGVGGVHVPVSLTERGTTGGVQHQMAAAGLAESSSGGVWTIFLCLGRRGGIGGFPVLS